MADLLQITDSNFDEEIINSDIPSMVDFWAEWCGPCKMLGPAVKELAEEYLSLIHISEPTRPY